MHTHTHTHAHTHTYAHTHRHIHTHKHTQTIHTHTHTHMGLKGFQILGVLGVSMQIELGIPMAAQELSSLAAR